MNFSYLDIQRLRVFVQALKDGGFKSNLNQIPSSIRTDCFTLLRKLPQFQTEEFKDDNNLMRALNEYLRDPNKRKTFLSKAGFTQQQQAEFTQVLEEPVVVEAVSEQAGGQETSAGQAVGEPADTMTGGGGIPQIPNFSSARSAPPRIIRNAPTASEKIAPFTAADQTAAVKEAQRIVTTKTPVPEDIQQAFENEPEHALNPNLKPSIPTPIVNTAKDFSSAAKRFTKTSLGRIGGGLGGMLKGAVGAGGPALGNFGLKSINVGGNFLSRLSSARASASKFSSTRLGVKGIGTGRKVALAFSIFVFFFGFGLIAGIINPGATPTSEASPVSSTGVNGVDYTLPLRNPSVSVQDIREQIKQNWPNAQIDNWQLIIDQAKLHNWNPAVLLTLWIEESGAQGVSASDPLGCDVKKPTTDIQISLGCFFNSFDNKFTNDQFPQFLLTYSSPGDPVPFETNPNFPKNFKDWYSKLVPTGVGAIQIITPSTSYTPGGGTGIVSCPLNGAATITLGSKDAGGHCTPQYQAQEAPCLQGDPTGRGSAIDAQSSDKAVFLPMLGGQRADWTVDTTIPITDGGIYVGQDLAASASYSGKAYRIRFVHLDSTQLTVGSHYPSGTFVGYYRTAQNHIHVTLQEDGVFKDSDLYFNLCK